MQSLLSYIKIYSLVIGSLFLSILYAQIDQSDINSKEYVEWVGTCETDVIEKAQLDGLASLTTLERVQYYIDTRRCKYKEQAKSVHSQVDEKQLKEDAQNTNMLKGKSGSITYCVGSLLLYLTLTNGQKL